MAALQPLHRPGPPSAFAPAARPFAIATLLTLALALATLLFIGRTLHGVQGVATRMVTQAATDLDLLDALRADYLRCTSAAWQVALAGTAARHEDGARVLQARQEDAARRIDLLLQRLPAGDARASVEYLRDMQARLDDTTARIAALPTTSRSEGARIAAADALPMLQAMVARLDRAVPGQRALVDEQGRAALHALATVQVQFRVLACLAGLMVVLAVLWHSRLRDRRAPALPVPAPPTPDRPVPDRTVTHGKTPLPFPAGALGAAIQPLYRAPARPTAERAVRRSSSRRTTS